MIKIDRLTKSFDTVKDNKTDISAIRKGLEEAVHRQLMSDVPYGVLLSGGLDSSVSAVLLADALGAKNIFGVSMPSKLTSKESHKRRVGHEYQRASGKRNFRLP